MRPDWDAIEGRPASRLDPDPLHVQEEQRRAVKRILEEHHQEQARAERNVWIGLLALLIVTAIIGAAALWLVASRSGLNAEGSSVPSEAPSAKDTADASTPPPLLAIGMRPAPVGAPVTALHLTGYATWYDVAPGNAAAGPAVRQWLGDWRGERVLVCSARTCLTTRLTDACACGPRGGRPTLLDLARGDFARLGSLSAGVLRVSVSAGTLPATDR